MGASRRAGFRMTWVDAGIVFLGTALTVLCWHAMEHFNWVAVTGLAHYFFLRCVFRVRRTHLLIWIAIFCANVLIWWLIDLLNGWCVLAEQAPVTLVVIGLEVRRQHYRGVGYSWKQSARGV